MSAEPIKTSSLPDTAKIQVMADPRFSALKRQKGMGNNRMIRNGIKIEKADDVFKLMDEISRTDGPGTFEFTVADMEGGEQVKWALMLGMAESEGMVSDFMNTATPGNGAPAGAVPGVPMNLGNGFVLTLFPNDPTKGVLTTPQRTVLPWQEGMTLPGVGLPFGAAAPATPVGSSIGIPMTSSTDTTLMDMLRSERDQRRENEMRNEFKAAQEAMQKRYEDLLEKLSKPTGPDPALEAMKLQLAATERRLEEEKRDAEARRREDTFRAELAATNQRMELLMRDAANHKPDPIAPISALLTQIMATNQQGTTALMSAMDKATSVQAAASQESTRALADRIMPPEKIMELLTLAKDKGPEQSMMLDGMQKMWSMMQDVVRLQRESGDQGEPPWVGMLKQGLDQVGQLGQAYLNRPVVVQPQYQPPQARPRPAPAPAQAPARAPVQAGPMAPPTPIRPPVDPNSPDGAREAAAASYFGKTGKPNPDARPVVVAPDAVLPPGTTAAAAANAYQELANATPDAVRGLLQDTTDEAFFGGIFSQIGPLRAAVAADQMDADKIAATIIQAQAALQAMNQFPPAMELLKVGQFLVLIERLLPDEDDEFVEEVVEALRAKTGG